MFGGGFWGTVAGADDHLTKVREAPPRPIELEFPEYIPPCKHHPLTNNLSLKVRQRICQMRAFASISDDDLENLNIHFEANVPLASLVPQDAFNSRPFFYDDELQSMIDEISIDNQEAFREVLRLQPLEGRKRPRLAYARNFFGSLEDMSRYFDTTYDNYYRVAIDKPATETKGDVDQEMQDETKEVYRGYRLANAEAMNPGARVGMTKNLLKMVMHKFQCRDHEPIPNPREKLAIRGVKIQSIQYQFCVARIPQEMKQARARFVEGPIMAIYVRDELRFKVKDRLFTPEKTGFVGERFDLLREIGCMLILALQRSRTESHLAATIAKEPPWWVSKERWGGGPTRWGQLSFEIFEDEDPSLSPHERRLRDEKREHEAEESRRLAEASPIDDNSPAIVDALLAKTAGTASSQIADMSQARRRKSRTAPIAQVEMKDGRKLMHVAPARRRWYKEWQQLRANSSGYDEKIIGRRVGNDDHSSSGFDEVFLLTSCNHHVAISKLRVHDDYLEWLQTGKSVENVGTEGSQPNVLYAKRSEWYNMFEADARKEFLIELWKLMCWLNRNDIPEAEHEKMRERRRTKVDEQRQANDG